MCAYALVAAKSVSMIGAYVSLQCVIFHSANLLIAVDKISTVDYIEGSHAYSHSAVWLDRLPEKSGRLSFI